MKHKRSYFELAAPAILMLAAACGTFGENTPPDTGKNIEKGAEVRVGLSLRVADGLTADGKAVSLRRATLDVDESGIHNVWVFQFDGAGDDATLVGPAYYIDGETVENAGTGPLAVPLIASGGEPHRLVFIANINDAAYSWNIQPGGGTYADLKSRYLTLSAETTTYGTDNKNLVMSGSAVTVVSSDILVDGDEDYTASTGPGVAMTHSLACVELNLSVDATEAAGMRVLSVQLRNVSMRFDLFDALMGISGDYPLMPETFDYGAERNISTGLISAGESKTFRWYVPRNARGTAAGSASPRTKNSFAIPGATYFEIMAERSSGEYVFYCVYPGADDVSDFNVIPNRKYIHTLTIKGSSREDSADSREDSHSNVMFSGSSNCYILNPPAAGLQPREFSIPVTQVNRYWMHSYEGYGNLNANRIEKDDAWTVYLLWQDAVGIVREITSANYDPARHVTFTKSTGTGGDDHFTVRVPDSATPGNFVMVIKKDDPGDKAVLWSWHLWVTDYNPNECEKFAINGAKFQYAVPGGNVHRYGGPEWGYPNSSSNDYTYDPNSAGVNTRRFILDRNVGSLNASRAVSSRGNIFFQFGRKDPFPGTISLFRIDGTAIAKTATADFPEQYWNMSTANAGTRSVTTIKEAVENPLVLTGFNPILRTTSGLWNDVKAAVDTKGTFDPCPQGWMMPSHGTFSDFRHNITVANTGRGLANYYGVFYWPYIAKDGDYPVEGTVFFPFNGIRTDTALNYVNSMFFIWTTRSYSISMAYQLSIYNNIVSPNLRSTDQAKGKGAGVRCVSE